MDFDWHADKAVGNEAKHGVSFEEAATAFADPLSITIADPDPSDEEPRLVLLGQSGTGRLVVVAHVDRGATIRIISARLAARRERRDYEEGG